MAFSLGCDGGGGGGGGPGAGGGGGGGGAPDGPADDSSLITGSWEPGDRPGSGGLAPALEDEGRLDPGLSIPDSPQLELELILSSQSLSLMSSISFGSMTTLPPGFDKLLRYSDGFINALPSPFRLGNFGGINGSTICAPGLGASGTKSSSPFSLDSSLMFFLFFPLAISEGLRTCTSPSSLLLVSCLLNSALRRVLRLFMESLEFLLSNCLLGGAGVRRSGGGRGGGGGATP